MTQVPNKSSKVINLKILWARKMSKLLKLPVFSDQIRSITIEVEPYFLRRTKDELNTLDSFAKDNYAMIKKIYALNKPNFDIKSELEDFESEYPKLKPSKFDYYISLIRLIDYCRTKSTYKVI
jgi:hypothetical protein